MNLMLTLGGLMSVEDYGTAVIKKKTLEDDDDDDDDGDKVMN